MCHGMEALRWMRPTAWFGRCWLCMRCVGDLSFRFKDHDAWRGGRNCVKHQQPPYMRASLSNENLSRRAGSPRNQWLCRLCYEHALSGVGSPGSPNWRSPRLWRKPKLRSITPARLRLTRRSLATVGGQGQKDDMRPILSFALVTSSFVLLLAMASNLIAMASNLVASCY